MNFDETPIYSLEQLKPILVTIKEENKLRILN